MSTPKVVPGYQVDRDARGLTRRERETLDGLTAGGNQAQVARDLGVTRQRVSALVRSLERKGMLPRRDDRGYQLTGTSTGQP